MVRDRFQAVLRYEVDHAGDSLGEILFWVLQKRQLAACFEEERLLTAVDEEMYNTIIGVSSAEEEDFGSIIATVKLASKLSSQQS